MKYFYSILFIFLSLKSFCQNYHLEKPKELKYLDLIIERPKEPPTFTADLILPKNLIIKTIVSDDGLQEYDPTGKIVQELKNTDFYKTKTTYTYNKNILVEKVITIKGDKEKIAQAQEQMGNREKIRLNADGEAPYTTIVLEADDREYINKVNLDKKNTIIGFSYKEFYVKGPKKEVRSDNSYEVIYNGNQVSEIRGTQKSEKYFYTGKLLTKKVCINVPKEPSSQTTTETYFYQYDGKQNLVSIGLSKKYRLYENAWEESKRTLDSAGYDTDNRVIWHGLKGRFTTFKYDQNNNVTESVYTNYNELDSKKEYTYNTENEVTEIRLTNYKMLRNGIAPVFTQTFLYENHLLKEIQNSNNSKVVYEYNKNGLITKISRYNVDPSGTNKRGDNVEYKSSETTFTWNGKTMTVEAKYRQPVIYTFY
ncbi:hypothetical protein J8J42_09455 [Chryseobacterium sp. cx-311]|uniref:hypothetical protein n=1 Tax=Marnyiella aurantia TaxID=2758037 RepID=UPI001AE299AB|nr:hypothetical protein [Marnyiella aurantia]MBP0613273.1 hypothetical protein [Marnyiella aurantia]